MSEHDFGQRVMAAAGVCGRKPICMCDGQECRSACRGNDQIEYPDPLTPGGFCALWDALKKRGWLVFVGPEHAVVIGSGATYKVSHWNRAQALLDAAGQALGVSRG